MNEHTRGFISILSMRPFVDCKDICPRYQTYFTQSVNRGHCAIILIFLLSVNVCAGVTVTSISVVQFIRIKILIEQLIMAVYPLYRATSISQSPSIPQKIVLQMEVHLWAECFLDHALYIIAFKILLVVVGNATPFHLRCKLPPPV